MFYFSVTGKLHLKLVPEYDELAEYCYTLLDRAIKNRVCLNLCSNLSLKGMYIYPYHNYIGEYKYMPFEIVEPAHSMEFSPARLENFPNGYRDREFDIYDIKNSSFYKIQKFFEDIINDDNISHIMCEIIEVHQSSREWENHEIKADQFCETIYDRMTHIYMNAILRLNIIK